MKIRSCFVSNSSSSSFICDVCGEVESGYDLSLVDAGMYSCLNDHVFCANHIVNEDFECVSYNNKYENFNEYSESNDYEDGYDIPTIYCPICQIRTVKSDDILNYILKKTNNTKKGISDEIKSKFKDVKAFDAYLKNRSQEDL